MKILGVLLLSFLISGCATETGKKDTFLSDSERLEILQTYYLAEGVYLESRRPYDNILSEQEIILKAADFANKLGALHPDYYLYKQTPALMNAKIEAPVLLHGPDGIPTSYLLTAVDEKGAAFMQVWVDFGLDVEDKNFIKIMTEPHPIREERNRWHFITKREIIEFQKKRFPNKQASEPIAIMGLRLDGSRYSNSQTFWYFQIEDDERSINITNDEYLLDAAVIPYKSLKEGSNRAVVSNNYGGSPHLNRFRMVKLVTPLNLTTNTSERSINGYSIPTESLKFEGVPLE